MTITTEGKGKTGTGAGSNVADYTLNRLKDSNWPPLPPHIEFTETNTNVKCITE